MLGHRTQRAELPHCALGLVSRAGIRRPPVEEAMSQAIDWWRPAAADERSDRAVSHPTWGGCMMRGQALRFVTRSILILTAVLLSIARSPPANSQTRTAITFPEAIGSWLTPLFLAQEQGIFSRHNIDVSLVPAAGATVPRVTDATPFGLIGAPAALIQAEHGTDLKLIASFYKARLTGELVARPGICPRRNFAESMSVCE